MENRNRARIPPEKLELARGARVFVYMGGRCQEQQVLERRQNRILLGSLGDGRETPCYGQPACLIQGLADQRTLLVMLRFEDSKGRGLGRQDMFRLIPGTLQYIWPELNRLPMYDWSPLRVFAPFQLQEALLEDQAFLFSLSETEASLMVVKPLPVGAFADCTLPLGAEQLTARAVLARCEDLDGGACYRAHFTLIDQTLRPRLREFLLSEQARRLQAADRL